ncbi:hypothetical protein [Roseibium sp. SCP14]
MARIVIAGQIKRVFGTGSTWFNRKLVYHCGQWVAETFDPDLDGILEEK